MRSNLGPLDLRERHGRRSSNLGAWIAAVAGPGGDAGRGDTANEIGGCRPAMPPLMPSRAYAATRCAGRGGRSRRLDRQVEPFGRRGADARRSRRGKAARSCRYSRGRSNQAGLGHRRRLARQATDCSSPAMVLAASWVAARALIGGRAIPSGHRRGSRRAACRPDRIGSGPDVDVIFRHAELPTNWSWQIPTPPDFPATRSVEPGGSEAARSPPPPGPFQTSPEARAGLRECEPRHDPVAIQAGRQRRDRSSPGSRSGQGRDRARHVGAAARAG